KFKVGYLIISGTKNKKKIPYQAASSYPATRYGIIIRCFPLKSSAGDVQPKRGLRVVMLEGISHVRFNDCKTEQVDPQRYTCTGYDRVVVETKELLIRLRRSEERRVGKEGGARVQGAQA